MQAWCQKEAEQQTCMNEAASSDPDLGQPGTTRMQQ